MGKRASFDSVYDFASDKRMAFDPLTGLPLLLLECRLMATLEYTSPSNCRHDNG